MKVIAKCVGRDTVKTSRIGPKGADFFSLPERWLLCRRIFIMQDKKDKTNQARTLFSECSEEEKNKTISFLLGDREAFEEPVSHKLCLLPERR